MIRRFLILQNYEIQNETATIFEKKPDQDLPPFRRNYRATWRQKKKDKYNGKKGET